MGSNYFWYNVNEIKCVIYFVFPVEERCARSRSVEKWMLSTSTIILKTKFNLIIARSKQIQFLLQSRGGNSVITHRLLTAQRATLINWQNKSAAHLLPVQCAGLRFYITHRIRWRSRCAKCAFQVSSVLYGSQENTDLPQSPNSPFSSIVPLFWQSMVALVSERSTAYMKIPIIVKYAVSSDVHWVKPIPSMICVGLDTVIQSNKSSTWFFSQNIIVAGHGVVRVISLCLIALILVLFWSVDNWEPFQVKISFSTWLNILKFP